MRNWLRNAGVLFVCSSFATASWGQQAAKPQYSMEQIVVDSKVFNAAKNFLKSGSASDAAGVQAVETICKHYMAQFTELYDNKVPKFQNPRNNINSLLTARDLSNDARAVIVKQLNAAALAIVRGNHAPAAKVNAVYVMGELDSARDLRTGARTPFTDATTALVGVLNSAEMPVYLKVAAMSALERHIKDGWKDWPATAKERFTTTISNFAVNKPKDDLNYQANLWLARRAFDILKLMDAGTAVDAALGYLADASEFPSLRAASLDYLQTRDWSKLSPEQKTLYLLGIVHYLRSQSVDWYRYQNDLLKRKSAGGMGSGGMGGMGGPPGGYGGDGGDDGSAGLMGGGDGGGFGGSFGGGFGGGGYGGEDGGGRGGPGGARGNKPKAVDLQDWQTRLARRHINEFTQLVHRALDGKRVAADSGNAVAKLSLTKDDATLEQQYKLNKLISVIDDLQKVVNDINRVRNPSSLLSQSKMPIEDIMDFAKKMPGFLDKYPELKTDEEELEEADQPKSDETGTPDGGGDKPSDGGDKPADGGDKPSDGSGTGTSTGDGGS